MEDEIAGLTLHNDENDVWSVPSGASKLAAKFDFNLMVLANMGFCGCPDSVRAKEASCFVSTPLCRGENFYPLRLTLATKKVSMGWDMSLRAMPHRLQAQCSVWLRNVPVERPYGDLNDSSNVDDRSTVMVDFSKSLKDHPMTVVGGKNRARFASIVSVVFTGSDSAQALHIFYAAGSVE
ncbi:hypothetical protein Goklo_022966 [Gossypium klotzschianum]|uniref:Uncharacterized protein n=1 Tax=Gossypium klotzschianum TaxID=34286 RepID=A0A7J8TPG2_9ROSI|nr:hypothetical protein [Gossypium klotzschianum]